MKTASHIPRVNNRNNAVSREHFTVNLGEIVHIVYCTENVVYVSP